MRRKGRIFAAVLLSAIWILTGCVKGEVQQESKQSRQQKQNEAAEKTDGQVTGTYAKPEMKGEITISCFYEQEFLTAAARKFMDAYPEVEVIINVYRNTSESGTLEDYQTYLNTRIMTGKAEDIIFNTFLPVKKYSEMGSFEDLSRYISMTPEMNDENYFMNVLQAAREESGKIYIIPYMAKFNALGFSKSLLENNANLEDELKKWKSVRFSEGMNLAKQLVDDTDKKNSFLIQVNELSYTSCLIKDSLSQFIDLVNKKVNIDTPEYINLLKSVKELSEHGYFSSDIDYYNTEYYYAAINDYDVQAAFYSLDTSAGIAYCMPLADRDGNVDISANGCLALNSVSSHKDLAWEFIKYLLSEDVQTMPSVHGLAVNRQGFEASVERYYNYYGDSSKENGLVDKTEYGKLMEGWMSQINGCDMLDPKIQSLIEEENGKFFSDKQTAEETAKKIQKKVDQYFNE